MADKIFIGLVQRGKYDCYMRHVRIFDSVEEFYKEEEFFAKHKLPEGAGAEELLEELNKKFGLASRIISKEDVERRQLIEVDHWRAS